MKAKYIAEILKNKFGKESKNLLKDPDIEVKELVTDSRNHFHPLESLFFAIHTPGGNNGHRFIGDLYAKGVRNFVVEQIPENLPENHNANLFIVPDTIKALMEIGRQHRDNAKLLTAIAGSRGKTTLKEILFQLLEPSLKISRSPRSFNSKIGVPLSLWQIPEDTDLAIIEAGISRTGEMQPLADIIEPDIIILTNIGDAHASGFSSPLQKALEKSKIADNRRTKTIIYNSDDPLLTEVLKELPQDKRKIGWSLKNPDADLYLKSGLINSEGKTKLEYKFGPRVGEIEATVEKTHDIENIAAALAFLLYNGLTEEEIKSRFKSLHHINTRMNVSEGLNGCSVIRDSYTSDLSSLLPAIDFALRRKMPSQSLTLIISDLRHEGEDGAETYKKIASIVKDAAIERFIGIGKTISSYKNFFPSGSQFFSDTDSFLKTLTAGDFTDEIILLKGGPEFSFGKIREMLEARKHETVLEVNLDAMLRNYNYFRSHVPSSTGIIAMVKASGYGAGSYEIAKTLQDAGAAYLAVAALDEGVDLRKNGIIMPVMVLNPRSANYRTLFKNRLEPAVYSLPMLKDLTEEAKKYGLGEYPVHIKLDTGMHRMGFLPEEIPELNRILTEVKNIRVASIFSHLATADCPDLDDFTFQQLERFENMSSEIINHLETSGNCQKIKRHILNSAGILRFPEYHYDLVRLGIGLYGANTLPPEMEKPLSPVSTLRTVIICIREIDSPDAVGYGRKGEISGPSKIATLPIGYADGMNRHFGNGKISVWVNGRKAPTIGNICMDAIMIDVTGIDCQEGDTVEIFGENISIQSLADSLDTIPYEILTSVSPRVKRVYYRE